MIVDVKKVPDQTASVQICGKVQLISYLPKPETFVYFTKITANPWLINKITPVSIAFDTGSSAQLSIAIVERGHAKTYTFVCDMHQKEQQKQSVATRQHSIYQDNKLLEPDVCFVQPVYALHNNKKGNPVMKVGLALLFLFVCFHAVSNIRLKYGFCKKSLRKNETLTS